MSDTGNVAVEFECRGEPSGLSTTESDWYAFVFDGEEFQGEVAVFITTERLKRLVDCAPGRLRYGGDNNSSAFKLLGVDRLLMGNSSLEDFEEWVKERRSRARRRGRLVSRDTKANRV